MKKINFMIVALFFATFFMSCGSDKNTKTTETVENQINEFDIIVKHLETYGNFINSENVPAMITADKVFEGIDNPKFKMIDLRNETEFAAGHVKNSINLPAAKVIDYVKSEINAADFEKIIFISDNGQEASYVTSVMRLIGYDNTVALKFGMCAWNKEFADKLWLSNIASDYEDKLEVKTNPKNAVTEFPKLNTGKTTAKEILLERAKYALSIPYNTMLVSKQEMFDNGSKYYIINFWEKEKYDKGHIPGAIQYTPKSDFNLNKSLNTLPTDKPVVIYCYTGQTAGFVAAFLTILGYDAKVLNYGANSFMHEILKANEWNAFGAKAINNFELVK